MWEHLQTLFSTQQYIPHGHCYLWQSPLVGLHVVSDLLIALAYFSIPMTLLYYVYRRPETLFPKVFMLFGAFILLCGTGHLLEVWTLWQPTYWLSGLEKALTALVSCYTALKLVELLPQWLALRTPQELAAIQQALQAESTASTVAHQSLQRSEQALQAIVTGTASVSGEAFFPALVQTLATALDVPYVLVSECSRQTPQSLSTLAFWSQAQSGANFEYALPGTPCGAVVDQATLCYYPGQVQAAFPTAAILKPLSADSYVGAPLLDEQQQVMGVLCIVSNRPLADESNAQALIKVFATRAAVELQRQRAETALQQAYDALETRVHARTTELVTANAALASEIQDRVAAETALRQQAEREHLLSTMTHQIHQAFALPTVLNTTVAAIRPVLQTDRVLIYQLHPDGSGMVVAEATGASWQSLAGITLHDSTFATTYLQLYQQGRVQAVADIYTAGLTPCHVALLAGFQVRANLAVPIVYEEKLWGLLVAQQCDAPRVWQLTEIELLQQLATQAAIAIQKAALYQQAQSEIVQRQWTEKLLHQQMEREQLLSAIAQRIRQSLNLQETLNTAVAEVRQLLQTNRVVIYRFNPDGSGAVVVEAVESGWLPLLGLAVQDNCFAATYIPLYQQGRIKATDNIQTDGLAPCHLALLAQLQVQANLVVPILQGGTLWGLLIAHHCAAPRHWQNWEADWLQQLATQLAIGIQQAELFEQVQVMNTALEQQVQERTAQLQQALDLEAALKRITDKVRDSLDEGQILQTAVVELCRALRLEGCEAGLYNAELTASTIAYECTLSVPSTLGMTFVFADDALPSVRQQLLRGEPVQQQYMATERTRTLPYGCQLLACPIYDDQGVLGDLWLFKPVRVTFDEPEVRLVQQVANQCAIALRQARLYQAAQAQVQALEQLNQLKDDFLSTVSHELRTPMANIKMATHLLEMVLQQAGLFETAPSPAARYFKILQDECRREIELINDLLDLARLDAGMEPLLLTTMALPVWLPHLMEPFVERTLHQQQHLQLQCAPDLPLLTTDLTVLGQVLTELLHNACKYTPAGETIQLAAAAMADHWQLSVRNGGVHLTASECAHMFAKFHRLPHHDPWKHGGTGLGLALVKKRVERLGGTIHAQSEPGWLTLTIHLPISPSLGAHDQKFTLLSLL
ncbi:GAF domain-containing protein [Leptolyngbya sp. FACHB-321]|uniref:GAF domain-containing protein n=1 Tax=Leptolyngbya sp. FACHB-321 TaxID=2692807 RepID=UPI0016880110|nr:GAF domain-containing protein [Leptolyngbya sp. FACHB-321]MBD2034871.1 GAF domain-containing protein [Leptolyngbya sp. FACHB-321]